MQGYIGSNVGISIKTFSFLGVDVDFLEVNTLAVSIADCILMVLYTWFMEPFAINVDSWIRDCTTICPLLINFFFFPSSMAT